MINPSINGDAGIDNFIKMEFMIIENSREKVEHLELVKSRFLTWLN